MLRSGWLADLSYLRYSNVGNPAKLNAQTLRTPAPPVSSLMLWLPSIYRILMYSDDRWTSIDISNYLLLVRPDGENTEKHEQNEKFLFKLARHQPPIDIASLCSICRRYK